MATGKLQGKIALVTGGSSGIGYSTCIKFLREGVAGLTVVDYNKVTLENAEIAFKAFAEEYNPNVRLLFVMADVSSEEQTQAYYEKHMREFNDELDINVQNAGIAKPLQPWETTPLSDYEVQMAVNTRGVWLGVKHGCPAMLKRPAKQSSNPSLPSADLVPTTKAIILISSVAALYGQDGMSPYNASKWAVRGLSLTCSREFGPRGIRCNSVHPGPVDTPMLRTGFHDPQLLRETVEPIPLKRLAQPEELANAIAFLCSDEASYITGIPMAVHGGQIQY